MTKTMSLRRKIPFSLALLLTALLLWAATNASAKVDAIEVTWSSIGPTGGAVNDLAIHPTTPSTMYAGTEGGVFKSTDSGATWSPATSGITDPTVQHVAIDPTTPDTLYAGTNGGVFKSINGGATWGESEEGLPNRIVRKIAIDPNAPSTLYAGTWGGGLFKSTDSGANWSQIATDKPEFAAGQIYVLTTVATTPTSIYLGIGEGDAGMYKSTDGGATWAKINNGLTNTRMRTMAVHPSNTDALYVGTAGNGVFKSTDGGANWVATENEFGTRYTADLVIDPAAPDTLYLGTFTEGMYKTTDGGADWFAINTGLPTTPPPGSHPWTHAVAVSPNTPNTVFTGMKTGLYKSTDGGSSWTDANKGLTVTNVRAIQVHPTMTTTLYAGTSGSGVFKSTDGGDTWVPSNTGLTNLFINDLVLDSTAPDILYVGTGGHGVFKSTDGAATWSEINEGIHFNPFVQTVAVDPASTVNAVSSQGVFSASVLYAGSNQGIYKSTDGGANWTKLSGGGPTGWVYSLAIDPNTTSTVYAGAQGAYKSTDSGATWTKINNGLLWDQAQIQELEIDPTAPSTLYLGYYAGVYKSTDGGANWATANQGQNSASIQSIAVDSKMPSRVYASAPGKGVFASDDGGATWTSVNDGLGSLWAYAVAVNPDVSDMVYAGTSLGAYRGTVGAATTGNPLPEDGNGDGVPDNQQANVETLRSETGNAVTLAAPAGVTLNNVKAMTPTVAPPANVGLPQGLIGFDAAGISAGGSMSMTIILQQGATASSYWKYGKTQDNQTDHWYEFLFDATTQTGAIISGRTITLYFVDGQRGDSDLTANGVIADPGGPGGTIINNFLWLPQVKR